MDRHFEGYVLFDLGLGEASKVHAPSLSRVKRVCFNIPRVLPTLRAQLSQQQSKKPEPFKAQQVQLLQKIKIAYQTNSSKKEKLVMNIIHFSNLVFVMDLKLSKKLNFSFIEQSAKYFSTLNTIWYSHQNRVPAFTYHSYNQFPGMAALTQPSILVTSAQVDR